MAPAASPDNDPPPRPPPRPRLRQERPVPRPLHRLRPRRRLSAHRKTHDPAIPVAHSTDLVVRHARAAAGTGSCLFVSVPTIDLAFGKEASPQSDTRK